jgi:plastocyanin
MPRARIRHAFLAFSVATVVATAQDQGPTAKPFSVGVRRFAFDPARIEVNQDDLVKIDLHRGRHRAQPHDRRIPDRQAGRARPSGHLRVSRRSPGTFRYYCNLQIEDGCRQMHGELVVRPRPR